MFGLHGLVWCDGMCTAHRTCRSHGGGQGSRKPHLRLCDFDSFLPTNPPLNTLGRTSQLVTDIAALSLGQCATFVARFCLSPSVVLQQTRCETSLLVFTGRRNDADQTFAGWNWDRKWAAAVAPPGVARSPNTSLALRSHLRQDAASLTERNNTVAFKENIPSDHRQGKVRTPWELLLKNSGDAIFKSISAQRNWIPTDNLTSTIHLKLREDLKRRKALKLKYEDYRFKEPKFASEDDKKLFYLNTKNRENLGPTKQELLRGVIAWQENGTVTSKVDCGWASILGQFLLNRSVPEGSNTFKLLSPLLVPDSWAFQHFVDGVLPKLMQAYYYLLHPDVYLLIFRPRDPIIFEMYEKLGFSRSQLVFHSANNQYHANTLINTCVAPGTHPDLWVTMRAMLGAPDKLSVPLKEAFVVLLTRAKSRNGGRHILNQNAVLGLLNDHYGTNRVILFKGGYNLAQSIDIFGKAIIVIGVHGGALYNMNLSPPGTHIVEIMPTEKSGRMGGYNIMWGMADILDHVYWRICEEPVSKSVNVDLQKLKKLLVMIDKQLESQT